MIIRVRIRESKAAMAHRIETVQRSTHVCVQFSGDWLHGEGETILGEIFAAVIASGHSKALVDCREAGTMESDTWMDFGEASYAATLPHVGAYRFSVLFRPEEVRRFMFWETVAVNRGVSMRRFDDETKAIAWLN
jgi:hypothetical protein